MITKLQLQQFVNSRSWYQTIRFEDDVISKGCIWCGDPAWDNIVKFLPESLEGMRILDLGCNAGLFCVRAALMGAKEVIGIDYTGWRPKWDFEEQQVFVKEYFEQKCNRKFLINRIFLNYDLPSHIEFIFLTFQAYDDIILTRYYYNCGVVDDLLILGI